MAEFVGAVPWVFAGLLCLGTIVLAVGRELYYQWLVTGSRLSTAQQQELRAWLSTCGGQTGEWAGPRNQPILHDGRQDEMTMRLPRLGLALDTIEALRHPKTDLMCHEVEATRVGRFKMWVHFNVLHKLVYLYLYLPGKVRQPFYEAVGRWVFGPNANDEDLRAVIASIPSPPAVRAAK